jgi:DNA polymerase-3 subunit gamma/tau
LLKTLEEPPGHVKFLFATTEVDKLPVTVLSRCQRFDLRRISTPMLAAHFAGICMAEGVAAEPEALNMIAEAAEGSVRDGLSILDQAIAHADLASEGEHTAVTAEHVLEMLGLADKSVQRRLFAAILAGDGAGLLDMVAHQFALGIEPIALMRAMMELTHRITVAQLGRSGAEAISAEDRAAVDGWADSLGAGQLHRMWQLLLKGHDEVRSAPAPLIAAEMALLRCLHAADLPDPGSLVKRLEEMAATRPETLAISAAPQSDEAAAASPAAKPVMEWAALVHAVEISGQLRIAQIMRDWVRVVGLAPGELRFSLVPGYSGDPSPDLRDGLFKATNDRWQVELVTSELVQAEPAPALRELAEADKAAAQLALRQSPLVAAALAAFPAAEMIEDNAAGHERAARNGSFKR